MFIIRQSLFLTLSRSPHRKFRRTSCARPSYLSLPRWRRRWCPPSHSPYPAENATLAKGADYGLTWSSVDTDASTFSIYLVNFVNWPPFYTPLALDIETALGAYTVRVPCAVDSSYGFQL